MDVARRIGILVVCAVPAIIGGGIVYHFTDSLTSIAIYQVVLLAAAGIFVSR
jgi:hypothetical protein